MQRTPSRAHREGLDEYAPPPVIRLQREPSVEGELIDGLNGTHISPTGSRTSSYGSASISRQDSTKRTTPTSKRMSRRFLDSMHLRSRSTSRASQYLPDFKPIDRSADVESQYEERAVMLARAGPPSPALPRSDSIFDMGAPRIPPIQFHAGSPERKEQPGTPGRLASGGSDGPVMIDRSEEDLPKDEILQRAILLHEAGQLENATRLFRLSGQGQDGLAIGQLMYGLSLRHGWGIPKDEAKAINWLRKAAASSADHEAEALSEKRPTGGTMKGDLILAIFELGNCFRYGWGCEIDRDLARHYYETAANLGDADAMAETAWCYETGFGLKKDKYKAAFWYRRSEQAGNKIVGNQWIWKPKYDPDPFVSDDATKGKSHWWQRSKLTGGSPK
ncbi:hypothetical protein PYCC9005_003283 [Savitreella phatthalungensis]